VKRVRVTLSISFDVDVDGRMTPEDLSNALERVSNHYSDGRYSFSSEMFRTGACDLLHGAAHDARYEVVSRLATKYTALDPAVTYDAWQRRLRLQDRIAFEVIGGWSRDVAASAVDEARAETDDVAS